MIKVNLRHFLRQAIFLATACASSGTPVMWLATDKKIELPADSEQVVFSFEFTNNGKTPVVFTEAKASCGCTIPKIDEKTYASGEKGTITGTYKPGSKRGLSTVSITVLGEEIEGDIRRPFSDTLKLAVFVPELVGIVPGITLWKKSSELDEKRVRLEVKQNDPLTIKLIGLNNESFTANLVEVFPGRAYDLIVKPKSTAEPMQAMATLESTTIDGKPVKLFAHFIVR